MLPSRCSGELYALMEVEKSATQAEIKKAYHQKALKVHPDKTGGTTTELFKQLQAANTILGDPNQRKIYDMLGSEGINNVKKYGMENAAATMLDPLYIRILLSIISVFFFLLLLFVSLCVINIDKNKGWKWKAVFTPIWILYIIIIPLLSLAIISSRAKLQIKLVIAVAQVFLSLIVLILFVVSLDSEEPQWTPTFVFIFIVFFVNIVGTILSLRPSVIREQLSAADAEHITSTSPKYISIVVENIFQTLCWFIFLVLINVRVLHNDTLNFYFVFTPLYIRYGLPCLISIIKMLLQSHVTIGQKIWSLIAILIVSGFTLYSVILISVKCQLELNEHRTGPKAITCIVPFFLLLILLNLIFCCACTFFSVPPSTANAESTNEEAPIVHENETKESYSTVEASQRK